MRIFFLPIQYILIGPGIERLNLYFVFFLRETPYFTGPLAWSNALCTVSASFFAGPVPQ